MKYDGYSPCMSGTSCGRSRDQRQGHLDRLAGTHHGQRQMIVAGDLLDHIAEIDAQIGADIHHALVIHRRITDARDDVPFLERIAGRIVIGLVYDNAGDRPVELQEVAQRRILQCLQIIEQTRLAVIVTVGDILQEQLDFLVRNDVADVLCIAQATERQTDHLISRDRRSPAVARVDGRVDLDAQARGRIVVGHEFNSRHDALGDRQRVPPVGKP